MVQNKKRTIADKLESHRLLIFNSRDAQVSPLLEAMGINTSYLDAGETLYNETMELMDQQRSDYQGQNLAYDNFQLQKEDAETNTTRTRKLVRVLSRNDQDLQDRIGMKGSRGNTIEEWIESMVSFYNHLLLESDFLSRLQLFNVTSTQLEAERDAVLNLRDLRNSAISEKGQAQEATRLRNEKIDELADYCVELKAVAEIALEGHQQLLEKLGIVVR